LTDKPENGKSEYPDMAADKAPPSSFENEPDNTEGIKEFAPEEPDTGKEPGISGEPGAEQETGADEETDSIQEPGSNSEPDTGETELNSNVAVYISGLCSEEQEKDEQSGLLRPLFSGVNLTILAGEIWGISSKNIMSARVLCQVIGNMRSYASGLCRLGPLGTLRTKRQILPHLFYIDTHEMLYDSKVVLEQFMFSTKQVLSGLSDAERQLRLLELLEDMGMGYIALTKISDLYETEKLLLELLIASESDSGLIVCDWTAYTFSHSEIEILAKITERLRYLGKAVVIGTMQPKLIGMTCDNTLFIYKGESVYCGSVEELYAYADKVAFVLRDKDAKSLGKALAYLLPGWQVRVSGEYLYLYNYTDKPMSPEAFYRLLADNGLSPDYVKINRGRVENSFEELVERYDLQK